MTKKEAFSILRLCQIHNLPKPQIRPARNEYQLQWSTAKIKVQIYKHSAALHQCRAFFVEQQRVM